MNFHIEVVSWNIQIELEPKFQTHLEYDGRILYAEGQGKSDEIYQLNGAKCQIIFEPVIDPRLKKPDACGTGTWSAVTDRTTAFLKVGLSRKLWEELWARCLQPQVSSEVWLRLDFLRGLPDDAQILVSTPIIHFKSN